MPGCRSGILPVIAGAILLLLIGFAGCIYEPVPAVSPSVPAGDSVSQLAPPAPDNPTAGMPVSAADSAGDGDYGSVNIPSSPEADSSQDPGTIPVSVNDTIANITQSSAASQLVLENLTLPGNTGGLASYRMLGFIPGENDTILYRQFPFQYRSIPYSITIPVDTELYQAANESPNKQMIVGDTEIGYFYRDMMMDPAMNSFYESLLQETRRIRSESGSSLNDDEYLELLTSFVQQIPYDNATDGNPRYPVEVLYDGMGDCDEKSMLLTGLLSREGYDVALLAFPAEKHATAGIRVDGTPENASFRIFSDGIKNYAYIETTTTRLIGFYDDEFETAPEPVIVPVGDGSLPYTGIDDVMKIFADLKTLQARLRTLEAKAGTAHSLRQEEYDAALSYYSTYNFVMATNDVEAARDAIRKSELRYKSLNISVG